MKKKILVIDDEIDFSEMVKINLEELGDYEVHIENNGSRGYLAALANKPNFILLDVVMKDMDGREVLRQIQADPETKNIPVVFLTALSMERNLMSELNDKAKVLNKPISLAELISCIEQQPSNES